MHTNNAFITLTYNPENLKSYSLRHEDYQRFMKRLRKRISRSSNQLQTDRDLDQIPKPISYYMAGEYGAEHRRPHFHACLFGVNFKDRRYWKKTSAGSKLYISEELSTLWQHQGFTSVGDVNFESAAYIARYIINKKTGPGAWKYYEHIDEETGEITDLKPEYNKMSLQTPIGKTWLEKYRTDVYPEGQVLIRGHKSISPKYYDKQQKKYNADEWEEMKQQRELQSLQYRADNTPQRLAAKEKVKQASINQLLRKL